MCSVFTSTYQEQKRQGSFVQPLHPMENHANGSGETTTLLTRSQRLLGGVVGFITGTSKNEVEALETPDSELVSVDMMTAANSKTAHTF